MKKISTLALGLLAFSILGCPPPVPQPPPPPNGNGQTPDYRTPEDKYPDPNKNKDGTDNVDVKILYPTVLISIPEYHFNRGTRVANPNAQVQFTKTFNQQNFKVLDQKQAEKVWKDDVLYKLEKEEDITAAASLAFKSGADILVIGEAFSEKGATSYTSTAGISTNIYTCAAVVTVKVIKASNGQILATDSYSAKGADTTELTAAAKAIDLAAQQGAQKMSTKLVEIWSDPRNRTIEIIVSAPNQGFTLKEAEKFRKALVKEVTGITEIVMREFNEGAAPMEISYNGDAQGLSSAINEKKIGGRKCTVTKMQEGKIFVNLE